MSENLDKEYFYTFKANSEAIVNAFSKENDVRDVYLIQSQSSFSWDGSIIFNQHCDLGDDASSYRAFVASIYAKNDGLPDNTEWKLHLQYTLENETPPAHVYQEAVSTIERVLSKLDSDWEALDYVAFLTA